MEDRAHHVSRASTSQTRGTQLAKTVERESFLNQRGNPSRAPALAVRPTQTRLREVIRPRTVLATRGSQGPMVVHVWGAWRASSKQRPGMQRASTVGLESTRRLWLPAARARAIRVLQASTLLPWEQSHTMCVMRVIQGNTRPQWAQTTSPHAKIVVLAST